MNEPLQVAIVTTAKAGREVEFEKALHAFFQGSLSLSGQLGVQVIRPAPNSGSRQYGIIHRFADRESLVAFRASPQFLEWTQVAQDLTEGGARVAELCGLESWFTLPGETLRPLPQWKMAVATYLGVLPIAIALAPTLGKLTRSWNFVLSNMVFNAAVVALLTWVVMPLLTRILRGWLYAKKPQNSGVARIYSWR